MYFGKKRTRVANRASVARQVRLGGKEAPLFPARRRKARGTEKHRLVGRPALAVRPVRRQQGQGAPPGVVDDDALAVPEVVPRGHEEGRRALAHFGPQPPRRRPHAVAAMASPHARRRGDGVVVL